MHLKKLFAFLLIPLLACTNDPYDTSTPENFVIALGQVSQQPEDHNPLPYFYEEASAAAILRFDQMGMATSEAFVSFKNSLAEQFPGHVKRNLEGRIVVSLDGFAGMKTRTFNFSATLIGPQLKARTAADYEFIGATEPDAEGVVQLTLKMEGVQRTLPIKKTAAGYRMFLAPEMIEGIDKNLKTIENLQAVFVGANKQLLGGTINENNFESELETIHNAYAQALNGM
ncbi:hypothetical protein [Gilvibacter sp.]|uniref:hypothetical protein n=1 Tax=Gilvibacter sp. TaxID=2729997 RepID=UPI003F4A51D7